MNIILYHCSIMECPSLISRPTSIPCAVRSLGGHVVKAKNALAESILIMPLMVQEKLSYVT